MDESVNTIPPVCKNRTIKSYEQLIRFRKAITPTVPFVILAVIAMISIISGAIIDLSLGTFEWTYLLGAVWVILVFWIIVILPRIALKKSPFLDIPIDYTFNDTGFDVNVNIPNTKESTSHTYDILVKVVETKTNFYLFITKNQAYIVDKNGFTEGTVQELAALLHAVLPDKKYKIK